MNLEEFEKENFILRKNWMHIQKDYAAEIM